MTDWYKDRKTNPPWEIGKAQPAVDEWLSDADIKGRVIDLGCGTGENSLHIAEHDHHVLGVDLSTTAINMAQEKAEQRQLADSVSFRIADVLDLPGKVGKFDTAIETGLLHNFDYGKKEQIVSTVSQLLKPGGRYLILAFNEHEPEEIGPPNRLRKDEVDRLFDDDWAISYIRESHFHSTLDTSPHNAWQIKVVKE